MSEQKKQIATTIKTATEDLFKKMSVKVKVECKSQEDGPYLLKIDPESKEDSGLLIGWHGETMLALQHLLRLLIKKKLGEPVPFVVDVGDYRDRQAEGLKKTAEEACSKVARTQKPVILRPMPAFERRIIHMEVKNKDGVKSESIGEGEERRIMISPEKME